VFLDAEEGLFDGAVEIEPGEDEDEEGNEADRTEAKAGFEREVAVDHGVS